MILSVADNWTKRGRFLMKKKSLGFKFVLIFQAIYLRSIHFMLHVKLVRFLNLDTFLPFLQELFIESSSWISFSNIIFWNFWLTSFWIHLLPLTFFFFFLPSFIFLFPCFLPYFFFLFFVTSFLFFLWLICC